MAPKKIIKIKQPTKTKTEGKTRRWKIREDFPTESEYIEYRKTENEARRKYISRKKAEREAIMNENLKLKEENHQLKERIKALEDKERNLIKSRNDSKTTENHFYLGEGCQLYFARPNTNNDRTVQEGPIQDEEIGGIINVVSIPEF